MSNVLDKQASCLSQYAASTTSANTATKRVAQKNLVFSLADEQYGIPLSSVKEVIGLVKVTPIPHVPSFFKGLINLRGRIISVIDLRLKLGLEEKDYDPKRTSIVISDVNALMIGSIVDDVNEVVGFDEEQIERDLEISHSIKRDYITGVAKAKENLVLLLDINKVLDPDDLDIIGHHAIVASQQDGSEG
ncbi:chemotaxis protein CheW [Enterovibrio calviensis]|uniref:chemotaxis protein CheW n=1 Tax=Enterovibrio calviensis TaxID=91359 RepID=UPI0004842B68|nr:chemotaxis protein CheW [Enterovibrio calviensis]